MRRLIISLAAVALCAVGAVAVSSGSASALTVEEQQASLDQANAVNELAVRIRAGLNPELCLSAEEALAAIQGATVGARIQTIAGALKLVISDPWWCESVQTALGAADEAAQLALASEIGATGGVPTGGTNVIAFGGGGIGAPGGGGGSGYQNQ